MGFPLSRRWSGGKLTSISPISHMRYRIKKKTTWAMRETEPTSATLSITTRMSGEAMTRTPLISHQSFIDAPGSIARHVRVASHHRPRHKSSSPGSHKLEGTDERDRRGRWSLLPSLVVRFPRAQQLKCCSVKEQQVTCDGSSAAGVRTHGPPTRGILKLIRTQPRTQKTLSAKPSRSVRGKPPPPKQTTKQPKRVNNVT